MRRSGKSGTLEFTVKKSTKTLLWVGGALGLVAVAGVAYANAHKHPASAVPAGSLPPGTIAPTASFTNGQKYTFAAVVPMVPDPNDATKQVPADQTRLVAMLQDAGWTNVTLSWYMGNGTIPGGFEGNASSYVATATWTGKSGTAVPNNVIALATT